MYPHGTVYQAGKSGNHSDYYLRPKLGVRIFYHLLRSAGFGFVSFAIAGAIFTFWPIFKEEIKYLITNKQQNYAYEDTASQISAQKTDEIKKEALSLGLNSYFSINIPKVGAKANIIANVDSGSFEEYSKALKEGVAHAKGTSFPGQGKTVYLFSHSTDSSLNFTRYNAVFYLLSKLDAGDMITVYFLDQKYSYQVNQKVVTSPKDTSWFEDLGQGEKLVLQTCDPPGTSFKRLLIIASPIY